MNAKNGYINPDEKGYPSKLKRFLKVKEGIFYKGDLALSEGRSIGIVGARKPTPYGMAVAKELGKRGAEYGVTVISGLAAGIDSAAHIGALKAGGKTVAVLGTGLDVFYPRGNSALQERIGEEGLLVTEYDYGVGPRAYHFPIRNRLIAALSDSVVVVESEGRSGSLITAECAAEMGKKVYGVPGNITSPLSFGPNKLIREGCDILMFLDDVFMDMGLKSQTGTRKNIKETLGGDERRVFNLLEEKGELTLDEIHEYLGLSMGEVSGIVTVLEMKELAICELGKVSVAKT